MNFRRLNHILIPQDARVRMAWLTTPIGRLLCVPLRHFTALTTAGRFVIIFWWFAAIFGINMYHTVGYITWSITTALLMTGWMMRWFFRVTDISLKATCPEWVPRNAPVHIEVRATNRGDRIYDGLELVTPFPTWDQDYLGPRCHLGPLFSRAVAKGGITARFSQRGHHCLMPFQVRRVVPFGLMGGPPVASNLLMFTVVPTPCHIRRFPLLTPNCYAENGRMTRYEGDRELVGVRPYRIGDRLGDIHAGTTLRTGRYHVKEYRQTRDLCVGMVLDTGQSAAGVADRTFEAAISLAAGVLTHLQNNHNPVDTLVVGDKLHRLHPDTSSGYLRQGMTLLAEVQPSSEKDATFDDALPMQIMALSRRVSVVVIIHLGQINPYAPALQRLNAHGTETICLAVVDPSTRNAPQGASREFSAIDIESDRGVAI